MARSVIPTSASHGRHSPLPGAPVRAETPRIECRREFLPTEIPRRNADRNQDRAFSEAFGAPRSELRERRKRNLSPGPEAVEGSYPSRGGRIAESLPAVTKGRRSAMREALRSELRESRKGDV